MPETFLKCCLLCTLNLEKSATTIFLQNFLQFWHCISFAFNMAQNFSKIWHIPSIQSDNNIARSLYVCMFVFRSSIWIFALWLTGHYHLPASYSTSFLQFYNNLWINPATQNSGCLMLISHKLCSKSTSRNFHMR